SSRRRHTRFSRDWSSDVCSSDLVDEELVRDPVLLDPAVEDGGEPLHLDRVGIGGEELHAELQGEHGGRLWWRGARLRPSAPASRSEERRVGKECRCRWWPEA